MSHLTFHLIEILELDKASAFGLEILYYSRKSIPSDTTLEFLEKSTSAQEPLVVRYPLSSNTSRSFFLLACARQYLSHFLILHSSGRPLFS